MAAGSPWVWVRRSRLPHAGGDLRGGLGSSEEDVGSEEDSEEDSEFTTCLAHVLGRDLETARDVCVAHRTALHR